VDLVFHESRLLFSVGYIAALFWIVEGAAEDEPLEAVAGLESDCK